MLPLPPGVVTVTSTVPLPGGVSQTWMVESDTTVKAGVDALGNVGTEANPN
jgi:hypothetical protein